MLVLNYEQKQLVIILSFFFFNFLILIILLSIENGHNPMWNETCDFIVKNPNFAFLRFEVQDEDMFGEKNFIGQAVYPVNINTIHI